MLDTVLDLGFIVAAFVPLVLYWMYVYCAISNVMKTWLLNVCADLALITFMLFGVSRLVSV